MFLHASACAYSTPAQWWRLSADHGYEYWLEFATLLTAVRGQDILPWDHDTGAFVPQLAVVLVVVHPIHRPVAAWRDRTPFLFPQDLGLPYPPDGLRGVEALRKQLEQETGFWTKFDASRDLLQAFPPDAPGWVRTVQPRRQTGHTLSLSRSRVCL